MSTHDAAAHAHDGDHGHDDHDHPEWLAHHFDTPEQQFDSGKLGMWLFLVTEVLFFSGMFCAYAIYRYQRPDVFEGCSEFLNTQLGAINTGVLLFSSLTMAWAVRCAQTGEHKKLVGMIATTICCAMIFLGVKAIEYSHKWSMGLLPPGLYSYGDDSVARASDTQYLIYISLPFFLALIAMVVAYAIAFLKQHDFYKQVFGPLTVGAACYFVGVGLGMYLESGGHHDEAHGASHAAASGEHGAEHHEDGDHDHDHGDAASDDLVSNVAMRSDKVNDPTGLACTAVGI
ncbi:MAG: cytochrome c oxidase subunit 3, partial [Planctomycetota bacterium]